MNALLALMLTASTMTASSTMVDAGEIDESALQTPSPIAHRSEEGKAIVANIQTVMDEQLSKLDRRRFGKNVLSASRVMMVDGTFAAGGEKLVTVNVQMRLKDPDADPRYISGVFTLAADGTLASTIVPLQWRAERFDLTSIGDVDGDGLDDLRIDASSRTGDEITTTNHLYQWTAESPTDEVLGTQTVAAAETLDAATEKKA